MSESKWSDNRKQSKGKQRKESPESDLGNQGKKIFWSFGILEKAEKERKTRDSEIDNYFILFLLFQSYRIERWSGIGKKCM